jgi:hypothetical protein
LREFSAFLSDLGGGMAQDQSHTRDPAHGAARDEAELKHQQ